MKKKLILLCENVLVCKCHPWWGNAYCTTSLGVWIHFVHRSHFLTKRAHESATLPPGMQPTGWLQSLHGLSQRGKSLLKTQFQTCRNLYQNRRLWDRHTVRARSAGVNHSQMCGGGGRPVHPSLPPFWEASIHAVCVVLYPRDCAILSLPLRSTQIDMIKRMEQKLTSRGWSARCWSCV